MCAATASEHQAEAPSKVNLLLQRLQVEAAEGKSASVSPFDISLLLDLGDKYYRLKRRHEGQVAIERAKEIVADQIGCKLAEAHQWIQKKATAKNKTFEETVEMILLAEEMRREGDGDVPSKPAKRKGA